jgi:hypothetical protein
MLPPIQCEASCAAYVRVGPFSDVSLRGHDVHFAPMNRHGRYTRRRPKSAIPGHGPLSFNHLVGQREKRRRHFDTDRACGPQIDRECEPRWFLKGRTSAASLKTRLRELS